MFAGGLGASALDLVSDQRADRVILTQPGASATPTGGLADPSDAPEAGEVAVHLDLTNQSFEAPSVDIRVSIDGDPVVERVMEVKDQHHVARFHLALKPGDHRIAVQLPDRGEQRTSEFAIEGETWVSVTYWGPDLTDDQEIDIFISDEEIVYG